MKGDIIINHRKNYVEIGTDFGILNSKKVDQLPLNDIDKRIIGLIEHDVNILDIDDEDIIGEDMVHHCGNTCNDLDNDIQSYLDQIANKIEWTFYEKRAKKWENLERQYLLAFYRPFHFYKEKYGIYIKINGQRRFIRDLKRRILANQSLYGSLDIQSCYIITKTFFYFHELYHHKIESLATRFEITTRLPHYTKGFHCLYCNTFGTDDCLEETFAHVYAYYETIDYLKKYLPIIGINETQLKLILKKEMIEISPPGYNKASKIITDNRKDSKTLENYFFECLLRYSYKLNHGENISFLDESYWDFFSHATHTYITLNNSVTYVIEEDERTETNIRHFM
jgi:hypothetical protein